MATVLSDKGRVWRAQVALLLACFATGCDVFAPIGLNCAPGTKNADGCSCGADYTWKCGDEAPAGNAGGVSDPIVDPGHGGDVNGGAGGTPAVAKDPVECLKGTSTVRWTVDGVTTEKQMTSTGAVLWGYRMSKAAEDFGRDHIGVIERSLASAAFEGQRTDLSANERTAVEQQWSAGLADLQAVCERKRWGIAPLRTGTTVEVTLPESCETESVVLTDLFSAANAPQECSLGVDALSVSTVIDAELTMKQLNRWMTLTDLRATQMWSRLDTQLRRSVGYYSPYEATFAIATPSEVAGILVSLPIQEWVAIAIGNSVFYDPLGMSGWSLYSSYLARTWQLESVLTDFHSRLLSAQEELETDGDDVAVFSDLNQWLGAIVRMFVWATPFDSAWRQLAQEVPSEVGGRLYWPYVRFPMDLAKPVVIEGASGTYSFNLTDWELPTKILELSDLEFATQADVILALEAVEAAQAAFMSARPGYKLDFADNMAALQQAWGSGAVEGIAAQHWNDLPECKGSQCSDPANACWRSVATWKDQSGTQVLPRLEGYLRAEDVLSAARLRIGSRWLGGEMYDLSIQAANGDLTSTDRAALDQTFDELGGFLKSATVEDSFGGLSFVGSASAEPVFELEEPDNCPGTGLSLTIPLLTSLSRDDLAAITISTTAQAAAAITLLDAGLTQLNAPSNQAYGVLLDLARGSKSERIELQGKAPSGVQTPGLELNKTSANAALDAANGMLAGIHWSFDWQQECMESILQTAAASAGDGLTSTDRSYLNTEFVQLRSEIERIAVSEVYAGYRVLLSGVAFNFEAETKMSTTETLAFQSIGASWKDVGVDASTLRVETKANALAALPKLEQMAQQLDLVEANLDAFQAEVDAVAALVGDGIAWEPPAE